MNSTSRSAPVNDGPSGSTFILIPSEVASDTKLSPGSKLLYGAILSLSKASWGSCKARNATLARMVGLSVIQVRRLLQVLEERHLIERVMAGTAREEIRAVYQIDARLRIKMMQGDVSKRCRGPHQNDAPDKTSRVEKRKDSAVGPAVPQAAGPPASKKAPGRPPEPSAATPPANPTSPSHGSPKGLLGDREGVRATYRSFGWEIQSDGSLAVRGGFSEGREPTPAMELARRKFWNT